MAYAYRAFHAIPPMTSPAGVPTNAVFGFVRMLQRMIGAAMPDYLAAVFDTPEPTFRHERLATYKIQRPPMPADMASQIPWIKEYLGASRVACLAYPGYEADDVIATLAVRAAAAEVNSLIATSDKDLCQLVDDHVGILRAGLGEHEVIDASGVVRKFGVAPAQIVDYLTLVGDASDNVPGVQGIGPKTAVDLLTRYGTLESVFEHLDELKPRQRDLLGSARDTAFGMRELLRINRAVPVSESLDDLAVRDPDAPRLDELKRCLGFHASGTQDAAPQEPQMTLF